MPPINENGFKFMNRSYFYDLKIKALMKGEFGVVVVVVVVEVGWVRSSKPCYPSIDCGIKNAHKRKTSGLGVRGKNCLC